MAQLGADPDSLSVLARSLRDAAGRLDSLSSGLTRRARASRWSGPDAVAFEQQWTGRHRPELEGAASGLRDLAHRVQRHADEQRSASADGTCTTAPGPPSTLDTSAAAERPRSGPPALADVEERFRGTLEGRVGPFTGALTGELTIHHLDPSHRRVVLTQAAAGGGALAAGAGTALSVGGPHGAGAASSGASSELAARVGVLRRRSWEVDADRVDDLLARLAVEQAAVAATGSPHPQVGAASLLDEVVQRVVGVDPGADVAVALATAVPATSAVEQLVELELGGSAAAGLGGALGLGAGARAGTVARVGTVERGDRSATVLELEGAGTVGLTSTVLTRLGVSLPTDAHAATVVRIELPDQDGRPGGNRLLVRTSVTTDTTVEDTVVTALVDADGPGRAELGRAARAVLGGEPGAALGALASIDVRAEQVHTEHRTGTLSGHGARASAGAGVGISAGVTLRGQTVRLERG